MKLRSIIITFLVLICASTLILAQGSSDMTLKGEYIGQKPPGIIPEIFAPGFISTDKAELNSVFTPDGREFYFSIYTPDRGCKMYFTKDMDGDWSQPEPDYCPMLSPDGKYFFFTSKRSGNGDIYWVDAKIIEQFKPDDLK